MVCKIVFCSEFPDISDNASRRRRRRRSRRRTQVIAKRYAFHANAIIKTYNSISKSSAATGRTGRRPVKNGEKVPQKKIL